MKRVLVIDPKHTFSHPRFKYSNKMPLDRDFWVIYRPQPDKETELIALFREAFKRGNVTIYIDELMTLNDAFPQATEILADIVRTGREKGVGVWVAIQRPMWIPKEFLTETEIFMIFTLRLGDDRVYMSKFIGDQALLKLPAYAFLFDRADEGKPVALHLNIRKDQIETVKEAVSYD